jgi:anti-anti-sigma factor
MLKIATITVSPRRLDARTLHNLVVELEAAIGDGASTLVVDLSAVEYIDSIGLAVLVALKRRAGSRRVALAGLRPFVASVVRAAHLTDYFDVFATREAGQTFLAN